MEPNHSELRTIDVWRCCWCGEKNNDTAMMDVDMAEYKDCAHCERRNEIYASVEYMTHAVDENDETL